MADSTVPPSPPAKRHHRWLRILTSIFVVVIVLVVALYFVATSSAFFKGVILPKVGKAMNATITVREASIKPFSQVVLEDLRVQTTGPEPLLTAPELRARYHLWDILAGRINVDEVTVSAPTVQIIQNPDGTSNLDPLKKREEKPKEPQKPSAPSKAAQLDVKKIVISNATFRTVKNYRGGGRDVTEVSNFNLALTDLKNGQTGKLILTGAIKVDNNPPSPGTNGALQAKLDGNFSFGLSPDLKPADIKGQNLLMVENATGALSDLRSLQANLVCDVTPTEIKQVALRFQKGGATLGEVLLSGPLDLEKTEGHLIVQIRSIDRQVLNLVGAPKGLDFGATTINSSNQIDLAQGGKAVTVGGDLVIGKFSVTGANPATMPLDLSCAYNVSQKDNVLEIQKATGMVKQQGNPGGTFDASGRLDNEKKSGQISLRLTDINQNALRPFLETALGDKKLVSISINGDVSAGFAQEGDSNIKADVKVTKLVVSDPQNQLPAMPLEAGLQVDTTMHGKVAEIKQAQLALSPTQRARNQLQLQGRVDMSQTNAFQGGLKLTAESLDVTPYYDLFSGKPGKASRTSAPAQGAARPPAVAGGQEPPAKSLPFRNFLMELNIGRFYLREIEITNWVTALKLDGGRVVLDPLQLSVNGAPIKGAVDLNLGVPGYQYDISVQGNGVPLEPLANSFVPDKRGMYKGELVLNTQIKGTGTTGSDLQKSLAGQVVFSLTNANVQIASPKLKQFLSPVATLLGTPELLQSPITKADVLTDMGSGRIDFKKLEIDSPMFRLETGGTMPIAEVLTNSPFQNWPVNLYLSRSLAEKAHLVSSATGQTEAYVKLPNFLKVAGTLGDPKAQIDKTALAGTLLEKLGGRIPGGGLLQELGGALSGGQHGATNQSPATNKASPLDLLDLLKKKK